MIKTVLVLDDDADVRAAALLSLKSPYCRVEAIDGAGDPDVIARRHLADLLAFGSIASGGADRSSALREAFLKPVIPLFRPSVHPRRRVTPMDLGPGLMLGLADCRMRIDQHLQVRSGLGEVCVRWGGFTLKLQPGAFAFQGKSLGLTKAQSGILSLLMRHGGEVVSGGLIEEVVFHARPKSPTNFISVHISRLRTRLRESGSAVVIENIRGEGYALFWTRSFSTDGMPAPEVVLPGAETGRLTPGRVSAEPARPTSKIDWSTNGL